MCAPHWAPVSRLSILRLPGRTIIKDSKYSSRIDLFSWFPFEVIRQSLNHEMSADRLLRISLSNFNKVSLELVTENNEGFN